MDAITIIAVIKARAGREHELRGELIKIVGHTRTERGCLEFVLNHSIEDPLDFALYERWETRADVQAHLDSEAYREYRRATEELVESRVIHRLQPVTA